MKPFDVALILAYIALVIALFLAPANDPRKSAPKFQPYVWMGK